MLRVEKCNLQIFEKNMMTLKSSNRGVSERFENALLSYLYDFIIHVQSNNQVNIFKHILHNYYLNLVH